MKKTKSFRLLLVMFVVVGVYCSEAVADILRYTDDSGMTHYVDTESKVPEKYRYQLKNAKPLPRITKQKSLFAPPDVVTRYAPSSSRGGKVEIFIASWCPHCRNLEKFLKKKRIHYTRYDIEKNAKGKRIYAKLGGGGIPITRIRKKQIIRGFNPNAILKALGRK